MHQAAQARVEAPQFGTLNSLIASAFPYYEHAEVESPGTGCTRRWLPDHNSSMVNRPHTSALISDFWVLALQIQGASEGKVLVFRRGSQNWGWAFDKAGLVVQVDEGVTEIADSLARVSLSTEAGHHQDAVLACRGVHPSFLAGRISG